MTASRSRWPHGDAETAARLRAFDWAATSLGPISEWPNTFRVLVDLVAASQQPMLLAAGPDLILIYNAAFAALAGPGAFGQPIRESLAHLLPELEAATARVLRGEAVMLFNQRLRMPESGEPAQETFAVSLTPVHDDAGAQSGFLGVFTASAPRQSQELMCGST